MRLAGFMTLTLGWLTLNSNAALAGDSAIRNVGGTIQSMGERPTVRLLAENVNIRIYRSYADVECVFSLYNQGPETTVKVGFPDYSTGAMPAYDHHFQQFEAFVDSKKVDMWISDPEDREIEFIFWWIREVHFEVDQTRVIRARYQGGIGSEIGGGLFFSYILHTGSTWAGPVGSTSVVVSLEDFGTERLTRIEPPGYELKEKEIRWTLSNFEPGADGPISAIELMWKRAPE